MMYNVQTTFPHRLTADGVFARERMVENVGGAYAFVLTLVILLVCQATGRTHQLGRSRFRRL